MITEYKNESGKMKYKERQAEAQRRSAFLLNDENCMISEVLQNKMRSEGKTESTITTYERELNQFSMYIHDKLDRNSILSFNSEDAHIYKHEYLIEERGLKNVTVNKKVEIMRYIYSVLLENKLIKPNPFDAIKALKVDRTKKVRKLDIKQVEEIIRYLEDSNNFKGNIERQLRAKCVVYLMLLANLKELEVVKLKIDNFGKVIDNADKQVKEKLDNTLQSYFEIRSEMDDIEGTSQQYFLVSERNKKLDTSAIRSLLTKIRKETETQFTANELRHFLF